MPMLSRIDLIKMQFYSTTTDTYTTCKELRGSYKTSEWFVLWKLPLPVGQLAVPLGSRKPIKYPVRPGANNVQQGNVRCLQLVSWYTTVKKGRFRLAMHQFCCVYFAINIV
jgi:hypothetical protein